VLVAADVEDDEDVVGVHVQDVVRPCVRIRRDEGQAAADHLHVGEEVVGEGPCDASADHMHVPRPVRQERDGRIELLRTDPGQRLAQVLHDDVGEAVEDVRVRRVLGPSVVLRDGVGQRFLEFGAQLRLQVGKALETEFPRHAHHCGR
jgi:hypothetical protein